MSNMDRRDAPSSPPAEDVQENPPRNEAFQAEESFRTAPATFQFQGQAPATTAVANVPRQGPNELSLDNDPSAGPQDPNPAQAGRSEARPRRARSPHGSAGTAPQAAQLPSIEQQLAEMGSYNYLAAMNAHGRSRYVQQAAGQRSNEVFPNMRPGQSNVRPRAGTRRTINPNAYVPDPNFGNFLVEQPSAADNQGEAYTASHQPRHLPQQTPRPLANVGPAPQAPRAPNLSEYYGLPLPLPPYQGQQAPGDVMRQYQLGQQGNMMGAGYGAVYQPQIQQSHPPQGPRHPSGSLPTANVGQTRPPRGTVRPSPYAQGTNIQGRVPASDVGTGYYLGGGPTRVPNRPVGPVRPVLSDQQPRRRHSPRRSPPRHQIIREEAAQRSRKRRRQPVEESSDEEGDDPLLEDDDEEEGQPIKKPSKKPKRVSKKAKGSDKKKADSKPKTTSRRSTKTRKKHGDLVERDDGTFWFRAHGSTTWEPTVRHVQNRLEMLTHAARDPANLSGPDRVYDVPPRAGHEVHDRTAYHHAHRHWYCRESHDWYPEALDPIFYCFERPKHSYRQDLVGPLRWRGHIVLNNRNRVITDWPDMPLTLSSKVEGWRLEAITRLDDRITAEDFRDRMPGRTVKGVQKDPQTASALGNHRSRFREENGLASWDHRDGTSGFTEAIRDRLTPQQRANNTTKGFDRLSPATIKRVREENKGKDGPEKYLARAGDKKLSVTERAARARGEKPNRTRMSEKPAKKSKEKGADEPPREDEPPRQDEPPREEEPPREDKPSGDSDDGPDDSQHGASEEDAEGEDEEETGYDFGRDDSTH